MARRLDRPPLAGLGRRPPGLRADPGQRLQGPGSAPESCPGRRLRPVLPGRLGRRARRARPGWRTSSSTCCSRGPSGSRRGRSTASRSSRRVSRTPRRPRTSRTTGSPSRPTAGSCALAVEADRMLGATFDPREVEAERHVIGEERAPRPRLAARPARPEPPGAGLSAPPLSEPDPRLARRPRGGSRPTTSATSTDRHYRPDGAVLVVVGDVEPEAALDRVEAHFGGIAAGRSPRLDPPLRRAAADRPARFHARRSRSRSRAGCSAGTRSRAATPTARRSTSSPTC